MTDTPLLVTFFNDHAARFKTEKSLTINELAELIRQTQAEQKSALPWCKLAQFGFLTTAKRSYRHDANVIAVTGIEGDYDREEISFDSAVEMLTRAQIEAIVYTSPSHDPDRPRWRVLCPLEQPVEPKQREQLMRRLNGVFHGQLSDESFTLSQSYYYGHLIECLEYRVEITEGWRIDTRDELDARAVGKSGRTKTVNGDGRTWEGVDLTEMERRIFSGEALHTSIGPIAGSYARKGYPIDTCIDLIGAIFTAAGHPRYSGRWDECVEFIHWVYRKEAGKITPLPATEDLPAPLPWLKIDWDNVPLPEFKWSVRDRIPAGQACLFSGHGGSGKSTIGLHLCCAHVLARDWLFSMPEYGPAWFIDAEDNVNVLHYRLANIVKYFRCTFADLAAGGLRLMAMAGEDIMLATVLKDGRVAPTPLYRQILEEASDVKPVQIVIASAANVFSGNENDRAQVQQFVGLLTRIAIRTSGSVTLIAHPSKSAMMTKEGYSGSTQWHNSLRARIVISSPDEAQSDKNVRQLEFAKNQYGPLADPITLTWQNGMFLPEPTKTTYEQAARDATVDALFISLMRKYAALGRPLSPKIQARNYPPPNFIREPEVAAAGVTKRELAKALERLVANGTLRVKEWGPPSRLSTYLVLE